MWRFFYAPDRGTSKMGHKPKIHEYVAFLPR